MTSQELTDRERRVLAAVIESYVATAEPAGSHTISRRFGLGVSPATIRNTMSDLEDKGFLSHPHTSAGRVPTHKAYRLYVDHLIAESMMRGALVGGADGARLAEEIAAGGSTIEAILRRAAQSLGVLTQELGVAVGPRFEEALLRRIDLVRLSSDRLLMVLTLDSGGIRTIFVEVPGEIADDAVFEVARVLNERLAGLRLSEVRDSLSERLRGAAGAGTDELLNIFVAGGARLFDVASGPDARDVVLGQASLLADQPEFASGERMRRLLELTETPEELAALFRRRASATAGTGVSITIGSEHGDPRLEPFTVVTAEYRAGGLTGVIGVIGPTRMPYEKVIALVSHTSRLVSDLLH